LANEVYLSYARNNATLARAVYRFFRSAGLRVWFDEAAPSDGTWLGRGQRAIRRARHHVLLLTDTTPTAWQRAELDFGARSAALNPELQTTPLLRDGYEPGELAPWLEEFEPQRLPSDKALLDAHLKELVERLADPDVIPRPPPSGVRDNPYPGLRPYGVNDARRFFGRDLELAEALRRLGTQPDGSHRRWLRVTGPAGVGKASFTRAGLVPAVVRGGIAGAPNDWRVAAFRPAERAADSLVAAVTAAFGGLVAAVEVAALLENDGGLSDLVREHLPADQGLVLAVDHLDDVLTEGAPSPEQVARFDTLLAEAVDDFDHRLFLFTTGRDDLERGVLSCLPKLAAAADSHAAVYALGGLTLDGIRDVLKGPARMAGRPWDEGLAARITTDALQTPDQPGRLCWTLETLWHGPRADAARYAEMGGLREGPGRALDRRLDTLGDDDRSRTRSLLCGLLAPGRGHGDVPIALEISDALVAAGGGPRASALVDKLESAGDEGELTPLVTTARDGEVDYLRLANSTLPQLWPALDAWLAEDRPVLERRREVDHAALRWNGEEAALPDGARLLYYAGDDLSEAQRLRLRASMRTESRHFVEGAERHAKAQAEALEASARIEREAKAKALADERADTGGRIRRLRLLALLLLAGVGALGVLWMQATLTAGDLRTHVTSEQRKQKEAVEALREVEQRHVAAEKRRKNAESERRTTEHERRMADALGAQEEGSADEMLQFVVDAAGDADGLVARISHADTDYVRRLYLQALLRRAEAALKKTPDNRRMRILLGRLHGLAAESAVAMGSFKNAQAGYEGAVRAFATLARGDLAAVSDLRLLATAHGRLGRYHADRRREQTRRNPKPALASLKEALAVWARLAELQPQNTADRAGAATEHASMGLVLHRAGRHAKALEAHDASIAATRALVKAEPRSEEYAHALARRLGYAGDVQLELGKGGAAIGRYTEGLELMKAQPTTGEPERTRQRLKSRLKKARALR